MIYELLYPLRHSASWLGWLNVLRYVPFRVIASTMTAMFISFAFSPWFIRADYTEVEMSGVRPQSGQLGTGSGNGLIEFGAPVDYKTKHTTLEAGYTGETWNVKLGFFDSQFDKR